MATTSYLEHSRDHILSSSLFLISFYLYFSGLCQIGRYAQAKPVKLNRLRFCYNMDKKPSAPKIFDASWPIWWIRNMQEIVFLSFYMSSQEVTPTWLPPQTWVLWYLMADMWFAMCQTLFSPLRWINLFNGECSGAHWITVHFGPLLL